MTVKKAIRGKKTNKEVSLLRHPRDTLELSGQAEAETLFLRACMSGRLPHAWLLTGPKGIGKATFAYRLIRFLLSASTSPNVDMNLPSIRRIQSCSHADLLVLGSSGDTDIGVDEARSIHEFLAMTPAEGNWRIVLIDSIDALNRNAANALLKILEEPPTRTLIFLVSHNPGMLLPTIRSRCRQLKLKPLETEDFARIVLEHAPDADEALLDAYHRLSSGSPGVALFLLEQEAIALYHAFLSLFAAGKTVPEWHKAHALAEQLAGKQDAGRFQALHYVLQYFFHQLIRVTQSQPAKEIIEGEKALLSFMAAFRTTNEWIMLWEETNLLLQDVKRIHLDRKQVLINIIASLQPGKKFK
jgi:DNA polymerase III subunit delta'